MKFLCGWFGQVFEFDGMGIVVAFEVGVEFSNAGCKV